MLFRTPPQENGQVALHCAHSSPYLTSAAWSTPTGRAISPAHAGASVTPARPAPAKTGASPLGRAPYPQRAPSEVCAFCEHGRQTDRLLALPYRAASASKGGDQAASSLLSARVLRAQRAT